MLVRLLAAAAAAVATSVLVLVEVSIFGLLLDLLDDLLDGDAAAGSRIPAVDDHALDGRQPRRDRPVRGRPDVRRPRRLRRRRRRRRRRRFFRQRRRTSSDASKGHSVFLRLVASLAVGAGLGDDVVVVVQRDADEAFLARDVSPLRVGVHKPGLGLLPLPVAEVLPLLVDLAGILAVEHRVEHDLRVVAVGIGPGAEALSIG